MSDVDLRGVSKRFPETTGATYAATAVAARAARPALDELDLTVESGELLVLVGPSGCGKSTTLRLIAGLEEPTTGRILIGDRDVTAVPPADRDIAMVFQSYALYPHMTVFDNLAFGLRLRKIARAEIKERVQAAAVTLAIDGLLDRRPRALSGGQRQRVAIGRALVRDPKVFLFDEPLSNLDAKLRGELRREIARIHKRARTTSVYVTHDQTEAMTLADRIAVLRDGELQQLGTPSAIYERPDNRFVAEFFGTPSMNLLPARVEANGSSRSAYRRSTDASSALAIGPGFAVPIPVGTSEAADVLLGIRPEALSLEETAEAVPLAAEVELREILGPEVLLHMRCDAGQLTVRTAANTPARAGDRTPVWIDRRSLHVFDAATEKRL